MPTTPRSLQRQTLRRTLETVEKKRKDVLTLTAAFDAHFKEGWEFAAMGQKELLALQEHARTRRNPFESYLIVRFSQK